ncbi:helix-turn-helix domain-containing protein [Streptomyces galilaeus]|uniref:Helix-turn-helix domain-containing protein n=2 Tax=Streptomyces galilaeus TaxID=33899 RepID=A0ABW9IY16_STRGJ
MFAEDRFGRRLRKEREDRGMTQADIARVLADEHDLKLHPTAVAKMEQRDSEKPRVIRLSEARAIADMFGLTVDEMTSTADQEIEALAREFVLLGKEADIIRSMTAKAMSRLQDLTESLVVPEDQLTPAIRQARQQIANSLNSLDGEHRVRIESGQEFIRNLRLKAMSASGTDAPKASVEGLRGLQLSATRAQWMRVMHRLYPAITQRMLTESLKADKLQVNTRLAAMLEPPEDTGTNWALAAVFAHGLWGHGAAEELDDRVARKMQENPDSSIRFTRHAALTEMAVEVQEEMESRWEVVAAMQQDLEPIWGNPDQLEKWIADTDAEETHNQQD